MSTINLGNYTDFYIPRIKWTNDAAVLSAQVINRHQNNLDLHFVNANTGKTKVVLNEKDAAYVEVTDNLTFLKETVLFGLQRRMDSTIYIITIKMVN